ncbi:hypothetical protein SAMN05192534_1462 [Alteribacillus persepolensis]|uniref:Uncharacterized protein n=1 Tax=Alteribacillus persepolensis TaxID=568899 RepID=A0A1G8KDM8_9BACI|nr:hypothetical protein SAMN05192534_1462 [Alteribacillus persepolensis]
MVTSLFSYGVIWMRDCKCYRGQIEVETKEGSSKRQLSFFYPSNGSKSLGRVRKALAGYPVRSRVEEGVHVARIARRMASSRGTIYKYLSIKERPNINVLLLLIDFVQCSIPIL